MKAHYYLIVIIIFLTGCSADFQAELVGGYCVKRSSPNRIRIEYKDVPNPKNKPDIPAKVVEVAWNEKYILAKQQHLELDEHTPVKNKYSFWILNVSNDKLIGPLALEKFKETIKGLGVPSDIKFVKTFKNNFKKTGK